MLSFDKLSEEGFEPADSLDIAELAAYHILLEQLTIALEELDPTDRKIAELFQVGLTEREIASVIGLSQKGVNKRKVKLFARLRERLKDYK